MELTANEIAKAAKGILVKGDTEKIITSVSSDTRLINEGDFFVPLVGPNFDGHDFLADAAKSGAAGAFVQTRHELPELPPNFITIVVDDTLRALGDVASFWRKKTRTNVSVITGSSGKTTTKEIMKTVLDKKHNALITEKNFNNLIGVPHTLLKLKNEHLVAVLEIGMNEKGELARLTEITDPDWGALTNIGTAHIGKLGSEEALIEAKAEMIKGLRPDAEIIYNADCEKSCRMVDKYSEGRMKLTFGIVYAAGVTASDIMPIPGNGGYEFMLNILGQKIKTELHTFGLYNIYNALCASMLLTRIGLSVEEIADGLKRFRPSSMRSQLIVINGIKFVLDCYNSNPTSLISSADSFCRTNVSGKRYILMGDMLELGNDEKKYHVECGEKLSEMPFDAYVTFGERAKSTHEVLQSRGKTSTWFDSHEAAAEFLYETLKQGDGIFIKGSRLLKLEKVFEELKEMLEGTNSFNFNKR